MQYVFWFSIFAVFHAYIGYPLSLKILSLILYKQVSKKSIYPKITFLITVYNEEKKIVEKLENTKLLDYPREKLQILVASDGSTDKTNSLVRAYEQDGIQLLDFHERRGKEGAQHEAIKYATGDIVLFSDVATKIDTQGLNEIVANFADSEIGCVSSEDCLVTESGNVVGEGVYVRYEMWLRRLESRVGSVVGLSGSFFAARYEVIDNFSADMQSDFRTVLNCVDLSLRAVTEPLAKGYYLDVDGESKEYERKIRTVLRGMTVFFRNVHFLNPLKYKLFAYQFFCHKLLRWLVPIFLFFIFLSNFAILFDHDIYILFILIQIMFLFLAITAYIIPFNSKYLKILLFFCISNFAILVAWYHYFSGKRIVMWNPSKR